MFKISFSQMVFFIGAALMTVEPLFFCLETRAESGTSIFAPAAEDKDEKPAAAPGDRKDSSATGRAPLPDGGGSPHLVVDERGNKTLVITGEADSVPSSAAADDRGRGTPVITGGTDSAPSSITTNERGNKNLIITGGADSGSSASIVVDEFGNKTLVIKGDDKPASSGIRVDERGHKTLVIKEDERLTPAALSGDDLPPTAPGGASSSPWHTAPSAQDDAAKPVEDRPYWIVDKAEAPLPYFKDAQSVETKPYWVREEQVSSAPYWKMKDSEDEGPYWAPKKPEKAPVPVVATKTAPAGFAPAVYDASASSSGRTREISVYMFKDEKGVVHISNAPSDPRFRLFNITVVDIKVQRGLAGSRMRFTHESLRPYILKAAATYNLDPALIAAIIKSESAFDANAVSWAGAQGLMQLMPRTAREVGCHDPFDPEANIMGGSRYIRWMLDRFNGNLDLAIAAYNCGPTRVAREWKIPNIAETRNYVVIVKRNYQRYKGEF